MAEFSVNLLGLRIFVSCAGFVGNVFFILCIIRNKFSHVKSFELFLLGLTAANLEEICIINIYDVIILQAYSTTGTWSCRLLKFLTLFGEIASILFTVIISIFRYQKLRDANNRVNPIYLDSIRSAWMLSGVCVTLSVLVCLPIFTINHQGSAENVTRNDSSYCPPDFFQCDENHCPKQNRAYKNLFILVCHLLPLIIVTVTSCLIISVLLKQRKAVTPVVNVSRSNQHGRRNKDPRLHRSTVAVVAAMGLFQVDWTLHLIFQWSFSPYDLPFWDEIEFFISISYTSLCPYVYGIGIGLFSLNNLNLCICET
ncbi:uncharacterized protein LOC133464809 [Cololabis saira]|uniref:uncharacterized protein LOC133464809 n=1 Tax=Cololabis saira TaxID=129043 RepID=UPI002AD30ED6|nr:uncharacterized protein LOC133464809 [Cololabis saira]